MELQKGRENRIEGTYNRTNYESLKHTKRSCLST